MEEDDNDDGGPSRKRRRMGRRREEEEEEDYNDDGGPSRAHLETIVNYVTMTTDISLKLDRIIDKMKRFIGFENYIKLRKMEVKTGMKEMIKVLKDKEPENCLQILVDVLVQCECLKNTGWKEKPDPISALLLELGEPISVIERLMESVKEGDVNKVKQLLSRYPIPQDMEHITTECCVLSLERRDLTLVKFLYQEYLIMLYNVEILKRILNEAVRVDFTEGVQFLFSQGLPPEEIFFYMKLLEKSKSVDMLILLLSEEKIRQSLNDEDMYIESILYHQILNSSTQLDCMSRVQILVDAGARVENLIAQKGERQAWLKIIKERWFKVFGYLLNQLKDINFTNRDKQNILHVILVTDEYGYRDEDGDVRNNILDFVKNLVERGIDVNSACKDDIYKDGQSPLMLSCKAGYYDVVKYLIERGADVNKVNFYGKTTLMLASEGGHKGIVEYLITHCGADVNKGDIKGQTALMLACEEGHKDVVEYLIQYGVADVDKVDIDGQTTALMFACEDGNKDVVEYLIQHGRADVNQVDNRGKTALMWACKKGNKYVIEYMIQHGGSDLNKLDNDGRTALMLACKGGHNDVVKYLIEGGADVNKVDNKGQTALMLACEEGYKDIVEQLIQYCGADANKVDDEGKTALMLACEEGHKDVVEYVIQHGGADVDNINFYGKTALMLACEKGHKDIVEYLIQHGGADVNMVDNDGRAALMVAFWFGNKDVVEYLIQHGGADVNKVDNNGQTALIWACEKGNKDIVEHLIQHGRADVNKGNDKGQTALMLACKKGYRYVVEYLIQHGGADVNKVDNNGQRALMLACEEGNKDVVEHLIQHGRADVNKGDNKGQTALMLACEEGHKDIVEYLINQCAADVNMVDKNGWTALHHCLDKALLWRTMKRIIKEVNAMFKFLVESGADLSLPSNGVRLFKLILDRKLYELCLFVISLKPQIVDVTDKGENILHLLAKVNYEFTVDHFHWLFDCHVDINYENRDTDTPLMVAAVLLNEKYLEVFTHHPAVDLSKQNNHGHTALHCLILGFTELIKGFKQRNNESDTQNYCKQFYLKYMRCVDSLLGAGTDVNVQDNEGRTVLMMAVRENDKQLVRKLLDAGAMVDKVDRSGRHALHYVDFSGSVYDLTIFFRIFPFGENHLLDLPCIHGNTLIQTVLQFPRRWEPCKVVAFVRWLVSRNCSLRHLRGRTGHSTYNDLSLDDFSCSQRQNLRELLYRSGAPKEEIISTVNFQTEDEAENEINPSRNREIFEQMCLNVSLVDKCIIVLRQILGTEIRARLPGLEIPHLNNFFLLQELEIPHLNNFLLLEDVVGDGDDGVLGGFDEVKDESDSCSYIVDKNRECFHYLDDIERTYRAIGRPYSYKETEYFHYLVDEMRDNTRVGGRPYSYYGLFEYNYYDDHDADYDY